MAGSNCRVSVNKNGVLTIVCTGGGIKKRREISTGGQKVTMEMTEGQIRSKVTAAIDHAAGGAKYDNDADAIDGLNVSAQASSVRGQLKKRLAKEEKPAVPKTRKRQRRKKPSGERKKPKVVEEAPAPEEKKRKAAPRPTITVDWFRTHLKATAGKSKASVRAVDTLHKNKEFIGEYLSSTANQKAVSIAVFNELYKLSRFKRFLSSVASREKGDYLKLQTYLTALDKNNEPLRTQLGADASEELIRTARVITRYYLFEFEANRDQHTRYKRELGQLSGVKSKLGNSKKLAAYRSTPIDDYTITAAALYLRRWHADPTAEKQGRIPVWNAPEVISAEKVAKETAKPTVLQEFAGKEWSNLVNELFLAVRKGRPQAVGTLMRNLPEGYGTIEDALRDLHRPDIVKAFDRIFNEYLHKDDDFLRFVKSKKEFRRIARDATRLGEQSSETDRRLIARAVQSFINFSAQRTDKKWYSSLDDDLNILYKEVLGSKSETLRVDGMVDMRTMAALSVYTWRMKNRDATVGEWAKNIPNVTLPEKLQVAPGTKDEGPKRRRVLRLPP